MSDDVMSGWRPFGNVIVNDVSAWRGLGFKSIDSARAILSGIEMIHMIQKGQAKYAKNPQPSLAEQFERLAA